MTIRSLKPAALPQSAPLPPARPLLPPASAILPYLERIDATRWYSNFGPLNQELEARLSARAGGAAVCTVTNATQGLALLLRTLAPEPGLCLMPGFSFVATPHAALQAGLTPCFLDVDAQSWMLTPVGVREALARAQEPVAAIVVVAAFGAIPDCEGFAALARETGVPVILDAAAAFDTLGACPLPAVVSLHATKVLGAGEGGYVVAPADVVAHLRAASSFGFKGDRVARFAATNAKISEYAAAIALAALDAWPQARERWMDAGLKLRLAAARRAPAIFQPGWGESWISSTCVVDVGDADKAKKLLAEAGMIACKWWGDGLHREPAFAHCPRERLENVLRLSNATIGVPFFIDIADAEIRRIANALSGL